MKNLAKALCLALVLSVASPLFAAAAGTNPILSVTREGSGDNVRMTINNAPSNSYFTLYRRQGTQLWTTISNFGQTDYNGYYSQLMSLGSDGSNNAVEQYVTVGGYQSNTITTYPNGSTNCYGYNCGTGCTYNCVTPTNTLPLSQTSVSLNAGQNTTVYVGTNYYVSGGYLAINYNLYLSSNTNSSVATASISGNQITINAVSSGTTTMTFCSYTNSQCGTVYVTVNGPITGGLSLSQNSVSVSVGQSATVTAYNLYGGNYLTLSSNSNQNVVDLNLSGNQITLTGKNTGSSTVMVCTNYAVQCGTIYVTVSGYGSGQIWFSPSSLTMNTGETKQATLTSDYSYIQIYPYQPYVINSNSNPNVASASITNSVLYVTGISNGSTTIRVCLNNNSNVCGTMLVTVNGTVIMTLTPSSVSVAQGSSNTVSVTYSQPVSGNAYISNNSNSGAVTATISGSTLTVYGNYAGTSTLTICHPQIVGCGYVYVTVTGGTPTNPITFSPSSLSLYAGQSSTVYMYSNSYYGSYYLGYNGNSNVATAYINGNSLVVTGNQNGSATINVCQNSNAQCSGLYVTVGGGSSGYITLQTGLANPVSGQYYSAQLSTTGGTAPYTYTLISGNLPSGITLSSSGALYGTTYSSSASTFMVRVTDLYGRTDTKTFTLTPSGVLGQNTYANGTLISENGTIYIVYKNTKTGFASWDSFAGLGYSLSNVTNVGYSGLSSAGYTVSTRYGAHPWGSWIKSGNTVYFVHETGLIPVGDYGTFISNGGRDSLVVPANTYDFYKPVLSIMTYNDYRLK